ncbi:aromatic ring-hydroxylating dioxygenase subunit alpha [Scytonema sp. NUACC21]
MNILSQKSSVNGNLSTKPISQGLPGHYYFSPDIFALEMQSLWSSAWQFIGRESDLSNPGDYLTCIVGEQPLFVIRTNNGELRAMHNVCPHRAARLLDGKGNCNRVRCPYHAWSFDLEGKLQGLPQAKFFPNLDKSTVRLAEARVETWGGFIFVNPESEGESLKSYLADFPNYLEQYEYSWQELQEVDRWSYDEPVNWKFSVENYLECYHLPVVHAQSLECFYPKDIQYTPTGRHYQISVPYIDEESVKEHPAFSGEPKARSYQGLIFPNTMVNTAKDKVSVFHLVPLTPESTRFEVFIYQTPAQMEAFPYKPNDFRPEFDRVLNEDFSAVRLLQASVRSKVYKVQLAEELEFGISHFHKVLSEYLRQ